MLIDVTIDNVCVQVPTGSSLLQAAEKAGIKIPTLCYHPDQSLKAVCRVCVVEIEGQRLLQPACTYPVFQGMQVRTNSPSVREARQTIVELMLSSHPQDCLKCPRNLNCELQSLTQQLNITQSPFPTLPREYQSDSSTFSLIRNPNKCLNCRRCVEACLDVQEIGILYSTGRGKQTIVGTALGQDLNELPCVFCGQCLQACPVGAITEVDETERVWEAIADPRKHVLVQTAPAIRVALGEEFGMPAGAIVTGKLVAALRRLGFDRIYDTDFTADLTIIEEGNELLERLQHGGTLPMITSCSPGWIKFIEHTFPDLLPHLSTCKSPQQMFGALAKTYYAKKVAIDPQDIVVVSIMPCTAKKFEAERPDMRSSGFKDVDIVLTTRELARMLKQSGIQWNDLKEDTYDTPLGISTGAGAIFGATGGVMEAALRTVYEVVTGQELEDIDFKSVRGMDGIKEAQVELGGNVIRVGVAHGLKQARKLMEDIASGTSPYHFIEIMCCPGGCIGGGGQPIPTTNATRQRRIAATYQVDKEMPVRKSHQNEAVSTLYEEFLKRPLGFKSHELLHTHYTKR
ncbi:MAG: NADH-quinone oxidoreductase subunit G [Bacillota bacterium]|nr:MAG: NADH-quinone oxidoreductase subunit G [Bacillota bacterium]